MTTSGLVKKFVKKFFTAQGNTYMFYGVRCS